MKGFFLNFISTDWGVAYHKALARFLLDRVALLPPSSTRGADARAAGNPGPR